MNFLRLFLILSIFYHANIQASWLKAGELFSPRWSWENDLSTTLIKKTTSLNREMVNLDQFVTDIYETKKDDLALFRITNWKMLKKEKINSHLVSSLVTSGTYLSSKNELIYWSEIFHQNKENLIQCLVTSSHKLNSDQIEGGISICQD